MTSTAHSTRHFVSFWGFLWGALLATSCTSAAPAIGDAAVIEYMESLPSDERNTLLSRWVAPPSPTAPLGAIVVHDDDAEQRQPPSGTAKIYLYATGTNAFLGKLEMDGGGAVPLHRDNTEEYIYILEGSGTISIDSVEYSVGPNTAIFMPAGAQVTYQNSDVPLVALQIFAGPGPASKYDKWTPVPAAASTATNRFVTEPTICGGTVPAQAECDGSNRP